MLEEGSHFLYIYVMDRDFGFAPNPFHNYCTLATCKPGIRRVAQLHDWVMGVGGGRLKATGKCLFLMKITEITNFNAYWNDNRFKVKKPLRNGSSVMMVGDNIYHQDGDDAIWVQDDSHHSNTDGSPNLKNVTTDTRSDKVLISTRFYYFGSSAPLIELASINYKNVRNYRKFSLNESAVSEIITNFEKEYEKKKCLVLADPFDFARAMERVDQASGKLT